MYDPISEKYCDYNLKYCIDPDAKSTIILIINTDNEPYKIEIPSTLSLSEIFEIANDFVKSIVVNTKVNCAEYF